MECIHGARVSAREQISPLMVRVTLELEEPRTWASTGVGDEFIHLDVGAETLDADGHSERHYTVSGLVDGGLELEVFLHGDGPGATWGRECAIGDRVTLSDPKEYYEPPADAGLRVLVGDLTALPGIARILADASADERFRVVVELPAMSEARDLPSAAQVTVDWRIGGNGIGPSAVCDAIRGLHREGVLDDDCYVWVACESKESRQARSLLRREVGLPISHQRIVGYWHANLEQVMERWNALNDDVKAEYLAIWREDRTDEENWTELEPFLQSVGA
jgi:NADPH-dependent ferric siderophore reductase